MPIMRHRPNPELANKHTDIPQLSLKLLTALNIIKSCGYAQIVKKTS